jgi:predicted transposase YbfD/YdcC
MGWFVDCFADLPDPRTGNARRHDLFEILTIALAASVCGGETCVDFADFAEMKEEPLRQFLRLENGLPSHDTFSRIFRLLDPQAFSACFSRFAEGLAAAAKAEGVVAIDGKTLRRSFDRAAGASPLHMVNAFASETRLVLGQVSVADKSNEIVALRALVDLLDLSGTTVTADAMHCHKETAAAILRKGGDYVLALKGNQSGIVADVELMLADPAIRPDDQAETTDAEHGRIETRRAAVYATPWLGQAHAFPGLSAIAVIEATRETDARATTVRRLYCLSKPMSAARALTVVRAHWSVENQLHWVLDVVLDEDAARNRKDNGPENLGVLRRLALNLLRLNPLPRSIRRKIKLAGWNDEFLIAVLAQVR